MRLSALLAFAVATAALSADPLSKQLEIDLFREVPNRNLRGLAVRSDSRVLAGPAVRELTGAIPADLLWSLTRSGDDATWLIGTGPDGKIFRATPSADGAFKAELAGDLDATHVFALCATGKDEFLAGTSPQGTLALVRAGKVVASAALPVDSIFDLAPLPGAKRIVLVATGNPGRIYRVDLDKFAAAGETKGKLAAADLEQHGLSLFGEIRDRNVRRLLPLPDGRVIAGSAPKGNIYSFTPRDAGQAAAPLILLENRDGEVTDLLADGDSAFYAALTFSGGSTDTRVNRPTPTTPPAPKTDEAPDALPDMARTERFVGRAQLVWFPSAALPEVVLARSNIAFYHLAWREAGELVRWILISGGELGELVAYSPSERRSVNLGAIASSQANLLAPLQDARGPFLLLRNNAAGLSQLEFADTAERSLETRKLDLGVAADLGQIRFARLDDSSASALRVSLRTSFGSDEVEGWSTWTELPFADGGWSAAGLRGRYVQLRVAVKPGAVPPLEKATIYYLPQNRRPQLTDFRIFPANLGLIPAGENSGAAANAVTTLGQLLFPSQGAVKEDSGSKRKSGLLASPVIAAPGAQIVYWTLADPDDDNLAATFSLTPEGKDEWTDLAVNTTDSFVQFDISHLPEGRYRTRLAVREQAPRPEPQRLSYIFETDYLTVDRTPPEILGAKVEHIPGAWRITVEGRDALSLLEGAEFALNNGAHLALEHPLDGILDGRRETFVGEFPDAKTYGATSVEITVLDKSGNSVARRLTLK